MGKLFEKVGGLTKNEGLVEKGAAKREQAGYNDGQSGGYGGSNDNY